MGWDAEWLEGGSCIFQSRDHDRSGPLSIGVVDNNEVSSNFTYHDYPDALYHNGAARTVSASVNITAGATSSS